MKPLRTSFALAALLACPALAPAQPLPPGTPVSPQAPNLLPVVPLGMQRGTTLEVTLTGTNLAGPTGVWTSFPAKVTIPTDAGNGKNNASLKIKLEVPKDAPLGFHSIRLATARGMSNSRLFCIDDLPQVLEKDTNRSLKTAQDVPVPCVVVGRADKEITDYFKFGAKANQRVSFEVLGRRLGSTFDPQLTLYDAAGKELPGGHSNDAPGLQTDPRLTYVFKAAGDYVVAIRDVSYGGAADFHYRLRIGDFPCATTPLPLAAKRGTKQTVRFTGPTVDGVVPVEVAVPNDPAIEAIQVAPRGASGLYGWPVTLAVSDLDEGLEVEPNNEAAKANRINVPGAITGRFEVADDVDQFVFAAKKGKRYVLEAHTAEHLSPTDVYVVLRDAKGNQLQATNPAGAPRLDFTAPADGDYYLVVEHLHSWGGPDEVYRLTVTFFEPGFSLTVPIDRVDVAPGGTVSMPLFLTRAGYNGALEVSVVGAGVTGTATIPAGPPKPPNQASGTLAIGVGDVPPGPLVFRIQAKATIGGKVVAQFASVRAAVSRDLANLPVPPREMFTRLAVAVRERPPFSLTAKLDSPTAEPGKPATFTISVVRVTGFNGEVALSAIGLPPGATLAPTKVLAGQNAAKATVNLPAKGKLAKFNLTFQGRAMHAGRDFAASAPPVAVVVAERPPFTLLAKLDAPTAEPGKAATLTITVTRAPGFAGEIALSAVGLPPGATLTPAKVLPGQNAAKVEVKLAPTFKLPRFNVVVQGATKHLGRAFTASAAPVVAMVLVKK